MKCLEPGCNQPLIYVGIVPESPAGQPYLGFVCRAGHNRALPMDPSYKSWIDELEKRYSAAQTALRSLPAPAMNKVAVDSLIGEIMAVAVNLVVRRDGPDEAGTEGQTGVTGPSGMPDTGPADIIDGVYTIYTDGSCHPNPGPGGWGIVVINPDGAEVDAQSTPQQNDVTNNEAEYGGIMAGLTWAIIHGVEHVIIRSDSELCLNQIKGTYDARKTELAELRDKTRALAAKIRNVNFEWVSGEENPAHDLAEEAYKLAKRERGIVEPASKSKKRKGRKKR